MTKKNIHTFAICAYKESEYLEKCIQSILSQTVPSDVLISTSTPNDYIYKMAEKYGIPLYISDHESSIQADWNSAYARAKTPLITIAHQDDVYRENYSLEVIREYKKHPDDSLIFTDYLPIKHNTVGKRDINSRIKRLLRVPMKSSFLANQKWAKVFILRWGNSICCPSVTYNKEYTGDRPFTSSFSFCLDWDTFLKFAKRSGRFGYIDHSLIYYRIHESATTSTFIHNNKRFEEDRSMFNKMWPSIITQTIMLLYKKAYKTYDD